jgi:hypothetical protein
MDTRIQRKAGEIVSYQKDAETLDKFLTDEKSNVQKRIQEISQLILDTDASLEPIKNLISEHGLAFFNKRTNGSSQVGIVIGGDAETPVVLVRGAVLSVDKSGNVLSNIGVLSDYLLTADVDAINAGFDFVKAFSVNDNPITNRRKELDRFVSEFKGFNINALIQ